MNKLKLTVISLFALVGVMSFVPSFAYASPGDTILQGANSVSDTSGEKLPARAKSITNILLFVLGAVSVVMIIIGSIRYVVSAGEGSAVKGAKNTILYAVIGLIVALLAYAIVNFVITSFK